MYKCLTYSYSSPSYPCPTPVAQLLHWITTHPLPRPQSYLRLSPPLVVYYSWYRIKRIVVVIRLRNIKHHPRISCRIGIPCLSTRVAVCMSVISPRSITKHPKTRISLENKWKMYFWAAAVAFFLSPSHFNIKERVPVMAALGSVVPPYELCLLWIHSSIV